MVDGDDRKSELIAQLAAQRTRLSLHAGRVRESADVGARLKRNFAKNRAPWIAGAVIAGLVVSRLRPRKSQKSARAKTAPKAAAAAGLLLPLAKLIFDLARPTLVSLLTARFAQFAAGRSDRTHSGPR